MRKLIWWIGTALGIAGVAVGLFLLFRNSPSLKNRAREVLRGEKPIRVVRVEVIRPSEGSFEKVSTQPGTVMAYESVELFAEASGYLKKQTVDLGDVVKKGALLAEVDVPDLEKSLQRAKAVLDQARAKVGQMKAAAKRVKAEVDAARVAIPHADAELMAAAATRRHREKQYRRMHDLYQRGGLEERLVDEAEERRQAGIAAERAAMASLEVTRAQYTAVQAKLEQSQADVEEAEAQVAVARADVDRGEVLVRFATIIAPFDGVITKRLLFPGSFVRSAREGERSPLLAIDRIDKVRVVVQIPDREAPYADKGDPAILEVDALDGKQFSGYISRSQQSQDVQTRTMRVEIDLDNPHQELRPGMFGRVTMILETAGKGLSLPSGCLVGPTREGQGNVYCVREGKAVLVPVRVGVDNGVRVEILSGLTAADMVIRRYSGSLSQGTPVEISNTQ